MRAKYIFLFGLLNSTLLASPLLESKPDAGFFEKFQPVKAPPTTKLFLKKGDRLAICGDSITEQRMYSRLMEDYLTMCVPQLQVTVRQYGWSGEQVPGFLGRMTNDCLRFKPTIATTCYGMNDFKYRPFKDSIGQTYLTNSTKMVDIFKANRIRVVLGSPGSVSKVPPWVHSATITTEDLDLSLCRFRNLDIALAEQEKVRFADVFWPMLVGNFYGQEKYGTNYAIPGNDGVHPRWAGHTIMAYAYLKALGLDGDIGTFTIDLKRNKIKVSDGHKVISAKAGEYEIESTRYPFCPCEPDGQAATNYSVCGQDGTDSDNSVRSGMTLVPFNEQLNRLILVVKNASAAHYQITWGNQTRTFTGKQLTDGINLAAEFPSNPFNAAFAKVDAVVAAKQAYETKEIQKLFRGGNGTNDSQIRGNNRMNMQQITAHADEIIRDAEKEHATLASAVESSFKPVNHVLKIMAE